jgi:SpoVK/Ycf46/Vps4 family AAA+-type ATPase
MQDRQGEAFVVATANNAEKLPPELLRKGRFDEVWWVDLPTQAERVGVLKAALRSHNRGWAADAMDLDRVAAATANFTGAELAAIVPDALFAAFADGAREPDTDDLLAAAATVVPLAKTAAEKILNLRNYWAGRARQASKSDAITATATTGAPALDL